ncbi:MAG: ribosome biogenesis GTPase Der [Candidatus Ancillula trichonymphae]|jgi:GTP-binding protein|nr:ribosome biogenesis GTPase Der [Candidatus Ancillula trichonymphae]
MHDNEELPVVAVVGRPNVGKSSLVNRILGGRFAVVEDRPGVTRDRVIYPTEWSGYGFLLMDTGGWDSKSEGLGEIVTEAAETGIGLADVVLFVVDATCPITTTDEALLKIIRKFQKPIILVANKADNAQIEFDTSRLWNLGLGAPFAVSALHGRSFGELLDEVVSSMKKLISGTRTNQEHAETTRRVALVGRPNVGKSSLLNKMAGTSRSVVSAVAGTTRDPVDEVVQLGSSTWKFVDTAGIRKKGKTAAGADFYALLRTRVAIEKSELVLCVMDASEPICEQDVRIANYAIEAGRALILVLNKWDMLSEQNDLTGRGEVLEREIEQDLAFLDWAPRVNLSAKTGWHKDRLEQAMITALNSWGARIPTAEFNAFLGRLVSEHPHPLRGGKQPRILFGTQASSRPPKFVIFATEFLAHQYRRFVERRIREEYGFTGSPLEISARRRNSK